tara:strand:+ start:2178 stop:2867 length:690 start_codon:yes stop_codon:yes gene_type:complete
LAEKVKLWFALNVIILLTLIVIDFSKILQPRWWDEGYSIAINLLTGGLVSFFFYWLVVYVPERRKRLIIKNSFSKFYREIKRDILLEIIFASQKGGRRDLSADLDTIDGLMTIDGFKNAFKDGREADEGYYAFQNHMNTDTPEFRQIIINLEMLAKQIEFVLHNYTLDDENIFGFFKRLELMLLSLRHSTPGYDESKALCGFLYQIFSGWNPIEGYLGYDAIEKMIADI